MDSVVSEEFVVQFYLRGTGQICNSTGHTIDKCRYPHYSGIYFYSKKNCDDFVNATLSTLPFLGAAITNNHSEIDKSREIRENPAFDIEKLSSGKVGKWSVRFIERDTDAWVNPTNAYWADFDADPAICCDTRYDAERYANSCKNLGGCRIVDAYVYGPDGRVRKIDRDYYQVDENGQLKREGVFVKLVMIATKWLGI